MGNETDLFELFAFHMHEACDVLFNLSGEIESQFFNALVRFTFVYSTQQTHGVWKQLNQMILEMAHVRRSCLESVHENKQVIGRRLSALLHVAIQ
jgi:hypothetical protein